MPLVPFIQIKRKNKKTSYLSHFKVSSPQLTLKIFNIQFFIGFQLKLVREESDRVLKDKRRMEVAILSYHNKIINYMKRIVVFRLSAHGLIINWARQEFILFYADLSSK